ncbi:MAG: hypothetical protein U9Q68_11320 [Euryarchaeota archaeon]|nr:hypothetical protein [Euryarchaeota archaeon]
MVKVTIAPTKNMHGIDIGTQSTDTDPLHAIALQQFPDQVIRYLPTYYDRPRRALCSRGSSELTFVVPIPRSATHAATDARMSVRANPLVP